MVRIGEERATGACVQVGSGRVGPRSLEPRLDFAVAESSRLDLDASRRAAGVAEDDGGLARAVLSDLLSQPHSDAVIGRRRGWLGALDSRGAAGGVAEGEKRHRAGERPRHEALHPAMVPGPAPHRNRTRPDEDHPVFWDPDTHPLEPS